MTLEARREHPDWAGAGFPGPEELEHLHSLLSADERDELLQCLLAAAPRGGEAMVGVLEQTLLCHATEELLGDPLGRDKPASCEERVSARDSGNRPRVQEIAGERISLP